MLKLLLLTVLCVLSLGNIASAEWELTDKTRNRTNDFTLYVDRSTIRKAGNVVKMWIMFDFTSTQTLDGRRSLSKKFQYEFECYRHEKRLLAFVAYSGQMETGNVTNSGTFENAQWHTITGIGSGPADWEIACGKR